MDIDSATLGEEEKRCLAKEGRCFCCKKQGHLLQECLDQRKSPRWWDYEDRAGGSKTVSQEVQEAPPKYEQAQEMNAKIDEVSSVEEGPEKKALHDIKGLSKEQWAKLLADLMVIDDEDF